MKNEIIVDGKTYVLKERTYKIGDKFKGWGCAYDVIMLIEHGTDKINFVRLEKPSGLGIGAGETYLYDGIKVKDKHKITQEELGSWWGGFFECYELIED